MNIKTRRRLLFFLIICFFLTGSGFLFYALGWSLNQTASGSFTLQKTGAIVLKTLPVNASIKINSQLYERQHNLFGSKGWELISGLLPGNYQIEVFENGLVSWQKNLTVAAGLVASASKIFLLPEKISLEPAVKTEVEKFWLTADKLKETKELFYALKQKQLKMPGWVPITQIISYPFDTNKTLIMTQKAAYFLDREIFNLQVLALFPVKAAAINNSEIALLDQKNNLQIYNLDSNQPTENISLDLSDKIIKIAFSASQNRLAFLDNQGNLFIYERISKKLKLVAEKIKNFHFSPDSKKIALLTQNQQIEILFLENYHSDFKMAAGETIKLNLMTCDVVNFDWLPEFPDYLIINTPEKIIITETDYRSTLNQWPLAEKVSDFSFDKENNLYFSKENQFFKIIWKIN